MIVWAEILWWLLFLPVALFVQSLVPGLDALIIGVIILAQERRWKTLPWFILFCILAQEGMGTLSFGASSLWYLCTLLFFALGRIWFEGRNFPFVLLLSCALCPISLGLMSMITSLQHVPADPQLLLGRGIVQALFIPVAWCLAVWTRRWGRAHDQA